MEYKGKKLVAADKSEFLLTKKRSSRSTKTISAAFRCDEDKIGRRKRYSSIAPFERKRIVPCERSRYDERAYGTHDAKDGTDG